MKIGDDVVINGKTYSIKKGIGVSCRGCSFYNDSGKCDVYNSEYDDFCAELELNAIYVEKHQPAKDLSNDELINELRSRGFKGAIELETTVIKKYEL